MKYEDDIHNCTNEMLAEMLEPIGFDIALNDPEAGAILGEVCRTPPYQAQGTIQP